MFKIIKKGSGNFWHNFNNGSKEVNLSDWEIVLNSVNQTVSLQMLNGANVPNNSVIISNVVVIDETDSSIEETFSNVSNLRDRLIELQYTPYMIYDGLIVSLISTDPDNAIELGSDGKLWSGGGGGGSVGTLQQVTDNGNTTTNDITAGGFLSLGSANIPGINFNDAEDLDTSLGFLGAAPSITTPRNWVLPDASGTIALISDIPPSITIDATPTDGSSNAVSSNGVFDGLANKQNTLTETNFGSFINGLTAKNTLVDADEVVSDDSADSNKAKKTSWLNVWNNYLKPKADALYQAALTSTNLGSLINGFSSKTTPVGDDGFLISNSADSNKAYKVSYTNLSATLKSYFDTLYATPALIVKRILNNTVETTPLTGTTSETLIYSAPVIAGGTFTTDDFFNFQAVFRKQPGNAVGCTYRVYVSNTNNFATASLLATWASQRFNTVMERRNLYFKADNTINSSIPATTSTQTDLTNSDAALTSISLNPANDIYFFVSAQLGVGTDNVKMTAIKIFN